ncbi:MAG TPA: protoporphyrinogen oxidase [Polyangiaceae bacterium]|nr:protoporphyrinogen oxidase [Polyangiaceae bacterium]
MTGAPEPPRVVVIGGGIAGVTAAYELRRRLPNVKLQLVEGRARLGGNVRTEQHGPYLVDAGPDAFVRTKPAALELVRELGLERELIEPTPTPRGVYVAHRGRLEPMPEGLMLGMPTRVAPLLQTPLLSLPGKLRMMAELTLPRGFGQHLRGPSSDESIAAFMARRFGSEAAERLVTPLLSGIYAGLPDQLSAQATFPQLCELEERFGSITFGLLQLRARSAPGSDTTSSPRARRLSRFQAVHRFLRDSSPGSAESPFLSLRMGLGSLIDALAKTLEPGSLRLGESVEELGYDAPSREWVVRTSRATWRADAVICAAPAHVAARIVPRASLARELSAIGYESTATVFFGMAADSVPRPLDASGFIVPPGEGGVLAATWVSSKWSDRAAPGQVLVRAFLGGARRELNLDHSSDEYLIEIARYELERLMGPFSRVNYERVFRHTAANPQPGLLHRTRLAQIRDELRYLPGLSLIGAGYDGVSLPDCIRQARTAVAALSHQLSVTSRAAPATAA